MLMFYCRKTGKTVPKVSRDADDFEPFEQVIGQAYQGDNPLRAANKKSRPVRNPSPAHDEEYDNSGEISMDIDSSMWLYPSKFCCIADLLDSPK